MYAFLFDKKSLVIFGTIALAMAGLLFFGGTMFGIRLQMNASRSATPASPSATVPPPLSLDQVATGGQSGSSGASSASSMGLVGATRSSPGGGPSADSAAPSTAAPSTAAFGSMASSSTAGTSAAVAPPPGISPAGTSLADSADDRIIVRGQGPVSTSGSSSSATPRAAQSQQTDSSPRASDVSGSSGGDSRGGDSRGGDSRGSDSRGSDSQSSPIILAPGQTLAASTSDPPLSAGASALASTAPLPPGSSEQGGEGVSVEDLPDAQGPAASSPSVSSGAANFDQFFVIQAGAFAVRTNADILYESLVAGNWQPYIDVVEVEGASLFAVRVGHYPDRASAEADVAGVRAAGGREAEVRPVAPLRASP